MVEQEELAALEKVQEQQLDWKRELVAYLLIWLVWEQGPASKQAE
jgi:hypothetical protein